MQRCSILHFMRYNEVLEKNQRIPTELICLPSVRAYLRENVTAKIVGLTEKWDSYQWKVQSLLKGVQLLSRRLRYDSLKNVTIKRSLLSFLHGHQ